MHYSDSLSTFYISEGNISLSKEIRYVLFLQKLKIFIRKVSEKVKLSSDMIRQYFFVKRNQICFLPAKIKDIPKKSF